ncbi:MAG: chromate transporter [Oscillospiraceae bacterium]|nr:chromate transporter [Oscillospiraceae bacterium]
MKKIFMLFLWFIKFGFVKPRDEYNIHDYIRDNFCPEYINPDEFDEKEQLLRDTPGPAGIKYAYYVGNKTCGIFGAIIAIFALLIPVIIIAVIIIFAYEPFMNVQMLSMFIGEKILNGMHAAVLGLIIAHVYKIMYFNHVGRKSMIFILPSALVFIFFADIIHIDNAVLMPFYIIAIILLGVLFGIIHVAFLKYRKSHPKKVDPYSKKAIRMRDRQIREDEENMKRYIDDDSIKRRRKQIEEEQNQGLTDKISKGEE